MAKFTKSNMDVPEIDPEALTVKLTGLEEEDLSSLDEVIQENLPEEEATDSLQDEEAHQADTSIGEAAPAEEILQVEEEIVAEEPEATEEDSLTESPEVAAADLARTDTDEAIIEESLLEEAKSAPEESDSTLDAPSKGKKDPVVILALALAGVMLLGFILFFSGGLNKLLGMNDTFAMTIDQFGEKYSTTTAFQSLSTYGFAFPTVQFTDEVLGSGVSPAPTESRSFYSDYIANSLNYQLFITGNTTGTGELKSLQVTLGLSSPSITEDPASRQAVFTVFAPYLQVISPGMSTEEAVNFILSLYEKPDQALDKNGFSLMLSTNTDGYYYYKLQIVPNGLRAALVPTTTVQATQAETSIVAGQESQESITASSAK